jgi:hypothetical protein
VESNSSREREADMPKIPLGARVEPAVKAAIEKAAKQEVRSLSSLVEKILVDWLADRKKKLK